MGNQVATGLSATRSANTSPDLTFVWDVVEQGDNLQVKVSYGGGTDIDILALPLFRWEPSTQSGYHPPRIRRYLLWGQPYHIR